MIGFRVREERPIVRVAASISARSSCLKRRKRKHFHPRRPRAPTSRHRCLSLKRAMYLACKRMTIPRSGCNTGERGTQPDCIPAASTLVHPFVRRSYVEAGGGYLDSLSTAQTVGGTPGQQTVQYNITIQATATSHWRRYRAVTAQHINRGVLGLCASALFPALSRFPLHTPGALSFHEALPIYLRLPSSLSRVTPLPPLRSRRRVPSPFDRVPSRFHLTERLYLIGWIINHR